MLSMLMTTEYAPAEDRHELQQLLLHIAGGERDALAALYQRTRTAVYGLALSYLKNAQDAQDLTQDVYVQVWDCAAQYRPTGSPMGWLLAVCRSLCLMRLRREDSQLPNEVDVLSSIVDFFLSTQGQISAIGTIISAGYGFICGAYMPISSFGEGLQKIISFLPSTYGTSLIRNHAMQGALAEMKNQGIPPDVIEQLKDSLDCNLYFFGSHVNIGTMYIILGITIFVLIGIYVLLNKSKKYNN